MFCNNTTYFLVSKEAKTIELLQHYLNSKLLDWYYRTLSVQLGLKAVRMFSIYVLKIPIPKEGTSDIYSSYELSENEKEFIESQQNQ